MFNIEAINDKCYRVISDCSYDSFLIREDGIIAVAGTPICSKVFIDSLGSVRKQLNEASEMSFLKLSGEGNEEIFVSKDNREVIALDISEGMSITVNNNYLLALLGNFKCIKETVSYLNDNYSSFYNECDLKVMLHSEGPPLILTGPLKVNSAHIIGWQGDTPRKLSDTLLKGCDLEFSENTKIILQPGRYVNKVVESSETVESVEVVQQTTTTVTKTKNVGLSDILNF